MDMITITFATYLTFFRIAIAVVMVSILVLDPFWQVLLLPLYVVGSFTDWLDGWLARRFQQQSDLGRFLDPVADKIFFFAATLILSYVLMDPWFMLLSFLINIRELLISALREFFAGVSVQEHLAVSQLGKYKTFVQAIAIGFFFSMISFSDYLSVSYGYFLLATALLMTYVSAFAYVKKTYKFLTNTHQTQ